MKNSLILFLLIYANAFSQETITNDEGNPITIWDEHDITGDSDEFKNDFVYFIKTDGETDSSVTGGEFSGFTLAEDMFTRAVADGVSLGGYKGVFYPGVYNQNITVTHPNLNLEAHGGTNRGLVHLTGTLSFNAAGTSNGLVGVRSDILSHSGSAGLYVRNVQNATTFTKDGSGYTEITNSAFSGVNTITGAGATNFIGTSLGMLGVANASQTTLVKDAMTVYETTLTAGTLSFDNNFSLPITLGGYSVTTSAGSVFLDRNTAHYDLDGSFSPLNISGFYSMSGVQFDKANSTLPASTLNLGNATWFDNVGLLKVPTVTGKTNHLVLNDDGSIGQQTITGGGGGSHTEIIKLSVESILDSSTYNITPSSGEHYILTNVSNIDAGFGTITGLGENDIVTYNGTDFTVETDVSTLTKSGEYQVYVKDTNEVYYYDLNLIEWKKWLLDTYRTFIADSSIQKGFGVSVNPDGTVSQVKLGDNQSTGGLAFSQDYADNINGLVDGARHVSFSREGTSYKMFVNTLSGFTLTNTQTETIAATNVIQAQSFVYNGGDVIVNVLLKNTGTDRLVVIPYTWDGLNYVAGTEVGISQNIVTKFAACINANNTMDIRYNDASNQYKRHIFIANTGVPTLGTETTTSGTLYSSYSIISANYLGKYLFLYNDGANKYTINDLATNLTGSEGTPVTMTDVVSVDGAYIHGDGKDGTIIAAYNDNVSLRTKWFNLINDTSTPSTQSHSGVFYAKISFGDNVTSGAALVRSNGLPAMSGWSRIGNGIILSDPSVRVGTRHSLNTALGTTIEYNGDKYFLVYGGDTALGNNISSPEMAIGLFTSTTVETPEGIAQNDANSNEVVKVALNGSVSSANAGLTIGDDCYLSFGTVVQYDTGVKIGKAVSSTDIAVNVGYNEEIQAVNNSISTINTNIDVVNNNITTINNNITTINSDVSAIDGRVTALEGADKPKKLVAFWTNKRNGGTFDPNVITTQGNKTLSMNGSAVNHGDYFGVQLTSTTSQSGFINFDHGGIINYTNDFEASYTLLYNGGSNPPSDGYVFMFGNNPSLSYTSGIVVQINPGINEVIVFYGNGISLGSRFTNIVNKYQEIFTVTIKKETIASNTYINIYFDGVLDQSYDITGLAIPFNNNFTVGARTGALFAAHYIGGFEVKQ